VKYRSYQMIVLRGPSLQDDALIVQFRDKAAHFRFDSMSARATLSPHEMPDIRLQARPFLSDLSINFLIMGGSPYMPG
jgi:hypothetical protein